MNEPGMASRRARAPAVPRSAVAPTIAVLAALLIAAPTAAASADPELAPYRELARSSAAMRTLAFARAAMESHWNGAAVSDSGVPDWPGAPPHEVYLSLVDSGATRACIGRAPVGSLAATLRALAGQVLAADLRHAPLRRDELDRLRIVVAFAGEGEEVADPAAIHPAREGLLIRGGSRSIAFLPGEARTISWALRTARRSGLFALGAPVGYVRFPVVTISEPSPPRDTRGEAHEDE
jgi:AMMECR1 domain-containing protein